MRKDRPAQDTGTDEAIEPGEKELRRLIALYSAGQLRAAEIRARDLIREFPGTPVLYNILGAALTGQGRPDDAVTTYKKVLKIKPDYAEAHGNMGIAYKTLGKLEAAIVSYRDAIRLKPDYAEAHSNLAAALQTQGKLDEAIASYGRALEIEPDFVEDHNNLGIALHELGRTDEAIECYREAVKRKPGFAEAHYNLARALQELGRPDEAAASYKDAIKARPGYASAHVNLGNAYLEMGHTDEAIAAYQKAIEIEPGHAGAHDNLGNLYLETGKLEDAADSYARALAAKPDFAEAHRHLANVRKHGPDDEEIAAMEALYARTDCPAEQKMHVAFGLAKAYDDLQQDDKAFDCLLEGNRLKRDSFDYDINQTESYFDWLGQAFPRGRLADCAAQGNTSGLPVFILGMPRSGTSLVEQILASHPQVFGAGELNDLNALVEAAIAERNLPYPGGLAQLDDPALDQIAAGYLAQLADRGGDAKRVTDKNPHNFTNIGLIATLLPAARIIHVRREAMDTCFSIFANYFVQSVPYAYDLRELGAYYRLYDALMDHWRATLPDQIYELSYEALVAEPDATIRALIDQCGLAFDPACLEFHTTDRPVRTASSWQVRQPLYKDSLAKWRRHEKALVPLREALEG